MIDFNRYASGALRRLRRYAGWRCREPMLIFESDDWGLQRKASSDLVGRFGPPGEWADEETETEEDLEKLYQVLSSHRDAVGRPAIFVANFVVANPDFDAIVRHQFGKYCEIHIDENSGLRAKWLEGMQRRVFFPQFHGRHHFSVERWLSDLQNDVAGARQLCAEHCHGGLGLIKGQSWKYHSEYVDWHSGREPSPSELRSLLESSLTVFERVFGLRSKSTVPPHYVCSAGANAAWRHAGIRYVQGGGCLMQRRSNGSRRVNGFTMGQRSPEGLLYLTRPVKFDPRPQRPHLGLACALESIHHCFRAGVPAVVDTHRINFTGPWRDQSLRALNELLTALRPYQPRFMTSVELGEAIEQDGVYRDVWTGEHRRVRSIDPVLRRCSRKALDLYLARESIFA